MTVHPVERRRCGVVAGTWVVQDKAGVGLLSHERSSRRRKCRFRGHEDGVGWGEAPWCRAKGLS